MKAQVLKALRQAGGAFVSGGHLSHVLSVSRTAVWKAVGALKEEGYPIESHKRKGYRLLSDAVRLTEEDLILALAPLGIQKVVYQPSVGSTNEEAKVLARQGTPLPLVVVAEEQTAGKGRRGRQWYSPRGEGLFVSLAFEPQILPDKVASLTHLAAEATRRALAEFTGAPLGIKWPNDLVLGGRKVVGILTELSAEVGKINHVVVGIGLNLSQPSFPEDLEDRATSLLREGYALPAPVALVARMVEVFLTLLHQFEGEGDLGFMIEPLTVHSVTVGRRVRLMSGGDDREVAAVAIDDQGALVVMDDQGKKETIVFGEVSVRGLLGYSD